MTTTRVGQPTGQRPVAAVLLDQRVADLEADNAGLRVERDRLQAEVARLRQANQRLAARVEEFVGRVQAARQEANARPPRTRATRQA